MHVNAILYMHSNAYIHKLTGIGGDSSVDTQQLIPLTFHTHCYIVHRTRVQ